jgi:hypothetical protein
LGDPANRPFAWLGLWVLLTVAMTALSYAAGEELATSIGIGVVLGTVLLWLGNSAVERFEHNDDDGWY